jgi:hypothetical protein
MYKHVFEQRHNRHAEHRNRVSVGIQNKNTLRILFPSRLAAKSSAKKKSQGLGTTSARNIAANPLRMPST